MSVPQPPFSQGELDNTITSINSLKQQYLTIHPVTPRPVLQIPQGTPFFIPPISTPSSFTFIIPVGYHLQLYPHPGPYPTSSITSSVSPAYTLTPSEHTLPLTPEKPTAYHAILSPTPGTAETLKRHEKRLAGLEEQLKISTNLFLYGIDDESPESLRLRLSIPTTSTPTLPAFLLHAIAALGDLLPRPYTVAAQNFAAELITSSSIDGSVSEVGRAFFERLPDQELTSLDEPLFLPSDPIRVALYALATSIVDREGSTDKDALRRDSAFAELFKTLAKRCIVWHAAEAWAPSFAWTVEMGTIRNFLVTTPEFEQAPFVLPVNVRTGVELHIDVGMVPANMSFLYSVPDVPAFLARQSHAVDALVAAVHYGADWDRITLPDELSRVRNTASYKMDSSGGVLYKGIYIDSPGGIADILMYGKVADVKLADLSRTDIFESRALGNLASAVDAVRASSKADAKTFKATFGAILGDIRRRICRQVAEQGLVFKSADRYMWIGCDDAGIVRLKKAVPFNGDPQSIELPLPDMGEGGSITDQSSDDGSETHRMSQDSTFLVQDVEGMKLESISEIEKSAGDVGMLALLAAVRFRGVVLDASFTHALISQRMSVKWVMDTGDTDTAGVKVDVAMKYAHLFVLEDHVVVDHDGQGWIYGVDYLRGRNGAPGKIMMAETEGCAPMPIVEVEFSVQEAVLVCS